MFNPQFTVLIVLIVCVWSSTSQQPLTFSSTDNSYPLTRPASVHYNWFKYIGSSYPKGVTFLAEFREMALMTLAAFDGVNAVLRQDDDYSGPLYKSFSGYTANKKRAVQMEIANAAIWKMWKISLQTRPSLFTSTPFWSENKNSNNLGGIVNFTAEADNFYNMIRQRIINFITANPQYGTLGSGNKNLNDASDIGQEAADAVWAIRAQDGFNVTDTITAPCTPTTCQPGQWWSPVAAPFAGRVPLSQWRNLQFFSPGATYDQFLVPPPPSIDQNYTKHNYETTKRIGGRVNSVFSPNNRTIEMELTARFWHESTAILWAVPIASMMDTNKSYSLYQVLRNLGVVFASATDSNIMQYRNKLIYWYWRPWQNYNYGTTAVSETGLNASEAWLAFHPFGTPQHPEYPAGHAMSTGTWTRTFEVVFGLERKSFPAPVTLFTRPGGGGFSLTFESLSALEYDLFMSRIWAGFHYPQSHIVSQKVGREIAEYALANLLTLDTDSKRSAKSDKSKEGDF